MLLLGRPARRSGVALLCDLSPLMVFWSNNFSNSIKDLPNDIIVYDDRTGIMRHIFCWKVRELNFFSQLLPSCTGWSWPFKSPLRLLLLLLWQLCGFLTMSSPSGLMSLTTHKTLKKTDLRLIELFPIMQLAAIDLCGTHFWKIKWRHLGFPLLIKMLQGFSAGSLIRHDAVMLSTILLTSSTGFRAQLAKARQFWRGTKTILLLPHWSSFDLQDEKLTVFAARTNQLAPRQTDSFEIASQALSWYYWE